MAMTSRTVRAASDEAAELHCVVPSAVATLAVRHEDVADAPHRLQVAGPRRIGLDQPTQTVDLHVDGAVERIHCRRRASARAGAHASSAAVRLQRVR